MAFTPTDASIRAGGGGVKVEASYNWASTGRSLAITDENEGERPRSL
jgi:hypothetical protein